MIDKCYKIQPPPKDHGDKPLFRVIYTIDVDASGPVRAAESAWQMMLAQDALGPVMVILDDDGKQTELDLSEYLEFNKITTGFVIQKYRKDCKGKFTCIDQEFIAGDDVQFENLKGDSIEAPQHEYHPFNMLLLSRQQIIDRLGDVLTSIDVGGEQSRQFAHEIKILDELLKDLGWTTRPDRLLAEFFISEQCSDFSGKQLKVNIMTESGKLWIQPSGFGDKTSIDGHGWPIGLEIWQGRLRLIVFDDINTENPKIIDLENAREDRRID